MKNIKNEKKLNVHLQKMMPVKKIFKLISDIGVDEHLNITDRFRIRFLNGLHFLMTIILLIGVTHWIILEKMPFTYIEMFCLMLSIAGLFLNKFKLFNLSYILFYLYCNFLIVYNVEFYPKEMEGYLYYFPFAMILGINNLSIIKNKLSFLLLFISFVIFLLIIFLDFSSFFPESWIVQFSEEEINWVRNFNIVIAGLCVVLFTYFYMWLSNAQTFEIKQLVEKEKKLQENLIRSLTQKEILLAEVHHRVKNNLAILNSLINVNLNSNKGKNISDILNSLQNRIHNMSIVHTILYSHENIETISLKEFIRKVINSTLQYHKINNIKIVENFDELVKLKINAVLPLGIILNELITNAIHYAFKNNLNHELNISAYIHNYEIVINISDNGNGLINLQKDGLGFELIRTLAEQINGKITFTNNNGSSVKIVTSVEELLSESA